MSTGLIVNLLLLLAMAAGLYVGLIARAEHKRHRRKRGKKLCTEIVYKCYRN